MKPPRADKPEEIEAFWRDSLTNGHRGFRFARRMIRRLPGPPRCKICNNPFGGIGGHVCRAIGMSPSKKNPRICALCCEKLPPGGAEIEAAILFADIRGSTALADALGPTEYAATLNRFYGTATEALVRHDGTIDKLIGDEVMGFFIPGFSGKDFKRLAIEAGQTLLGRLGYGSAKGSWLPVGVGIEAGTAYVGNVGGEGYVDFTALGDPVNVAARIQAAAAAGELLVGEAAFSAVADRYPDCASRTLEVKGKDGPIAVRVLPLSA